MADSTITREDEGATKRNRRVLITFARMEMARKDGRMLRLDWRELAALWTVFGDLMRPAAEWAFRSEGPDNPQPDLGTIIAAIGQATLATECASGSYASTAPELAPVIIGWHSIEKLAREGEVRFESSPVVLIAASDLYGSAATRETDISWAVSRWKAEVENRPLRNVHRRSLDTTWRQVIRHFGGDPDALVGPSHDALLDAALAAGGARHG